MKKNKNATRHKNLEGGKYERSNEICFARAI